MQSIHAFDPDTTHAMSAALDSAWQQLAASGHVETMPYRAAAARESMASAILMQARKGVSDPQLLFGAAITAVLSKASEKGSYWRSPRF
jgi:hypothetical protein